MNSKTRILIFLLLKVLVCRRSNAQKSPPHIILIIADDLGWNDVAFTGTPETPTPNIDALAQSGILLKNYYAHWHCTPSRAALLTGKYPIRLGLQHGALTAGERSGLPLDESIFPQHLKRMGYSNHMIGKWHLGYMTKEYTPTRRGFDTFFGYYNSKVDYFDCTHLGVVQAPNMTHYYGIDLQNGTQLVRNVRGDYLTDVFNDEAVKLIQNHDTSKPFFLYLAHIAVHRGNYFQPLQAPASYMKRVLHIKDRARRVHAAMAVALDDSVGDVFKALQDKGMLDNSIIVFSSDNGGETNRSIGGSASNYPLRGKKETVWEGGMHVPAFIWSPLFHLKEPKIEEGLVHVTDWLPTLYQAAGEDPKDLGEIDGVSQWDRFTKTAPSPRTEFLYNIDPITRVSAFRKGDMKVVSGSSDDDLWYNPSPYNCFQDGKITDNCNFTNDGIVKEILMHRGEWILNNDYNWRKNVTIICKQPPPANGGGCHPATKPCLFNLKEDPCEYHNLAHEQPRVLYKLLKEIRSYEKQAVKPQKKASDPLADPRCHKFAYVPWLDPEYYNEDCHNLF